MLKNQQYTLSHISFTTEKINYPSTICERYLLKHNLARNICDRRPHPYRRDGLSDRPLS